MIGYAENVRAQVVQVCTPALLRNAMNSPIVGKTCAEIEDALEACKRGELLREEFEERKAVLKRQLPIITPHATFKNGRRLVREAQPSGLSMFDIDHIAHPRDYWYHRVAERKEELGIVMAHVTPSTEGLRLVFRLPRGMNLEQGQQWLARMLGLKDYDTCVKDLARCSFLVPQEYVLYLDEAGLLEGENEEREESYETGESNGNNGSHEKPTTSTTPTEKLFKNRPYSDIIAHWFALEGGEPVRGERNVKLHKLAAHLRCITDNDEALLLEIMPRYGLSEEEMRGLIHSACSKDITALPRTLQRVLDGADRETHNEDTEKMPPTMPERLPSLIKLLVSRTPDIYKPAVAHAVFPALAIHLHRTRFRYIDNMEHEATLMNVLMAGTGAGKSCIDEPIRRILKDVRERDLYNLEREREWKAEVNSKGANKDKRKRPEGLIVQVINPDMTNPAFVMRLKEAEGHFLYTKMNEIDMFDALRGSGRGGQQFQIMCLAFDPQNTYGQTRVGTQSVTEEVTVRFNWNASTTILKGRQYFRNVLINGPISRINFCTIPERPIGSPLPVYGMYDEAFDEKLKPYIDHLVRAKGLVHCKEAYRLAKKLGEECTDRAILSQSRVYENLSFRANVIAYLKACVLYVANGCRWEPEMEDFIRWSLNYDLWCKMEFFGEAIERAGDDIARSAKRGPRNLMDLLPEEFTIDDVMRLRQSVGKQASIHSARDMVGNWVRRNYAEETGEDRYRKTPR